MSDEASQYSTQRPVQDRKQKKGLLSGIWTDSNGGPGPASWRMQKGGNVRGLARNKGVKAFWKTGFDIDECLLPDPRWQPLPGGKRSRKSR